MNILSVDGGGTKLNAVLLNEKMELLGRGTAGGTNPNQLPAETARQNMADCLDRVFSREKPEEIEEAYLILVGDLDAFKAELESRIRVKRYTVMTEARGGLLAGDLKDEGLVALSGTGSGVYALGKNRFDRIGGLGPIVGDEGSGAWIGQTALRAAMRETDGWGTPTRLTPLLLGAWGALENPRVVVNTVHGTGAPYGKIAALTRLVGAAAREGDQLALDILRQAGERMAEQMLALLKRQEKTPDPPEITLCGGAWKSHPIMLEAFLEQLRREYPGAQARRPLFEHVCAGPVLYLLDQGMSREDIRELLTRQLADFIVPVEEEN